MQDKMHTQVLEQWDMDKSRVELANLLARRQERKGLLRCCCDPVSTIASLQITGQAPTPLLPNLSLPWPSYPSVWSEESNRYLDTRQIAAPGPWHAGGL